MNSKKVNWFFLTTILLHILIVVSVVVFRYVFILDIIGNFIISSAIIVVPALLFLLFSKENWKEALRFHKIKWSTVGMTVVFTFLIMPLTTVINAFSMLFVENEVAGLTEELLRLPFPVVFFFMAISGPLCEEIAFRGVAYGGYRNSGNLMQACFFSALLFALGHMNFNQAAYAFVIGLIMVLLVEATGSIWASVIFHVVFNGYTVCMMYLSEWLMPGIYKNQKLSGPEYTESLIYTIAVYFVIAAVTTAVAACALAWIAKNERRAGILRGIWAGRKEGKGKIVSIPFIIAVIICLAYMVMNCIGSMAF